MVVASVFPIIILVSHWWLLHCFMYPYWFFNGGCFIVTCNCTVSNWWLLHCLKKSYWFFNGGCFIVTCNGTGSLMVVASLFQIIILVL